MQIDCWKAEKWEDNRMWDIRKRYRLLFWRGWIHGYLLRKHTHAGGRSAKRPLLAIRRHHQKAWRLQGELVGEANWQNNTVNISEPIQRR